MLPTTTTPEPPPPARGPAGRGVLGRLGLGGGLRGARALPWGHDLVAGTVVAAMLVPQAMAYAALAGVPPEAGLYASVAALAAYGLLGPSRALSVGPVAIDSLLTAQAVAGLALLGGVDAQRLGAALAVLVAGAYLLFWLFRLGVLAALLSAPMLVGFTHAAALVIAFSQVKHLAGVRVPEADAPIGTIRATLAALGDAHGPTLALGLGALAIALLWRARLGAWLMRLGVPAGAATASARCAPLAAVLATSLAVVLLDLGARGVALVGSVPAGLPTPALPRASAAEWLDLAPTALAIAAVGFLELLSIARTLAARRHELVTPDAELLALGAANVASGVVGGFPVTGGLSRSMVNHQAGAVSGRASLCTAALLLLSLALLTPVLGAIPRAALAAVVVLAVVTLIDPLAFARVWRLDRLEGVVAGGTFLAVLVLGVEVGMAVGAGLALVVYLLRLPRGGRGAWAWLLRPQGAGPLWERRVSPDAPAEAGPAPACWSVTGPLHLANAEAFEEQLAALLEDQPRASRVLLDLSRAAWVDATAVEALLRLRSRAASRGIDLQPCGAQGPWAARLGA